MLRCTGHLYVGQTYGNRVKAWGNSHRHITQLFINKSAVFENIAKNWSQFVSITMCNISFVLICIKVIVENRESQLKAHLVAYLVLLI